MFNGASTQKGQCVPIVGGNLAQAAKDGQRDTITKTQFTVKYSNYINATACYQIVCNCFIITLAPTPIPIHIAHTLFEINSLGRRYTAPNTHIKSNNLRVRRRTHNSEETDTATDVQEKRHDAELSGRSGRLDEEADPVGLEEVAVELAVLLIHGSIPVGIIGNNYQTHIHTRGENH